MNVKTREKLLSKLTDDDIMFLVKLSKEIQKQDNAMTQKPNIIVIKDYNEGELCDCMEDSETEPPLIEYETQFFLTQKEAKWYLKSQKHNLHENAHTYIKSAFYSDDICKLFDILHKFGGGV